VFCSLEWYSVLGKEGRNQGVSVAHHRNRNTLVDDPVETKHDGHALSSPHGHEHRRQITNEELAEKLQLFDHLTRGKPPGRGHPAIVFADVEPDRVHLSPKRPDHLGHDVE
jgi:hypothetical protein